MEEVESDIERAVRVKELEDMVKKLERENKQLLNKVKTTGTPVKAVKKTREATRSTSLSGPEESSDLESGVLNLSDVDQDDEDSWLYVSPKCPPTPKQLQVTPVKWFSEGHPRRHRDDVADSNHPADDLPSLDDVRKSLTFHINEMEGPGLLQPGKQSSSLTNATSRSAAAVRHQQRKVNQSVRGEGFNQRAQLRDVVRNGYEDIPKVSRAAPPMQHVRNSPHQQEDAIPRVKWNPQAALSHDDDDDEEEEVNEEIPRVRWNARPVVENGDDIPRVNWKRGQQEAGSGGELVPKVKWDPNAVANFEDEEEEEEEEVGGQGYEEAVPVVSWKRPPSDPDEDAVPVVKWRRPVQIPDTSRARQNTSDVPVVKWKGRRQSSPPSPGKEEVPVIKWKANQPAQSPPPPSQQQQQGSILSQQRQRRVPSISPSRRGEGGRGERQSSEERRMVEQAAERSPPPQRVSRLTAHQSGLQRPSARTSGTSPLRYRNTSPSSPHGGAIPKARRDGSPGQKTSVLPLSPASSPAARRRKSRSPSPSTGTFNDRQILPQKAHRSPSPSKRTLAQPTTTRVLASPGNSPQSLRATPPSQRQQLQHAQMKSTATPPSSAPKSGGGVRQRGLTPPGARSGGGGGGGLTPPSGRGMATPPSSSGRGRGRGKRILPSTPSGQATQQQQQSLRPPNNTSQQRRSLQKPQQQATPPRQPADGDDWLEGCF